MKFVVAPTYQRGKDYAFKHRLSMSRVEVISEQAVYKLKGLSNVELYVVDANELSNDVINEIDTIKNRVKIKFVNGEI